MNSLEVMLRRLASFLLPPLIRFFSWLGASSGRTNAKPTPAVRFLMQLESSLGGSSSDSDVSMPDVDAPKKVPTDELDVDWVVFGNPLVDVGQLQDFWVDLIEGEASKAVDFLRAYGQIIANRNIKKVRAQIVPMYTRGFFPYKREFVVIHRGVATGAVYISALGNDLYVSWRVFAKAVISLGRVIVWLILCGLLAGVFSFNYWRGAVTVEGDLFIRNMIFITIASGIALLGWGFVRADGDFLAIWRAPFNEFNRDDLAALALVMHKSVLAAADVVDIDSTTLAAREAPSLQQKRSRRI